MIPPLLREVARWSADTVPEVRYPRYYLDQLANVQPEQADPALDVIGKLAGRFQQGDSALLDHGAAVQLAWSAPEPVRYFWALADAAHQHSEQLVNAHQNLALIVAELRSSQQRASAAIIAANTGTDWRRREMDMHSAEGERRSALCRSLAAELNAASTQHHNALALLPGLLDQHFAGFESIDPPSGYAPPTLETPGHLLHTKNIASIKADLTSTDQRRREFAAKLWDFVSQQQADGTTVEVLGYDPDAFHGQGSVKVALGDIATADGVGVLVPGIFNSPDDLSGTAQLAKGVMAKATAISPDQDTAMVLWFGYDIPASSSGDGGIADTVELRNDDDAESGGQLLAKDLRWIATMSNPGAVFTAVGHSMGSTVLSQAIKNGADPTNVVLLGSPGVGTGVATTADYPMVTPQEVWVLSHDDDLVTRPFSDVAVKLLGLIDEGETGWGNDPAAQAFGAQQIDADSNYYVANSDSALNPFLPFPLSPIDRHGMPNYLAGAGQNAIAAILLGKTASVPQKRGRK